MKIYEEIIFDWNANVLSSKSFEYQGDLTLLKGGKSAPPPPPPPAQKAQTKPVDESQATARDNQRQKALKAKGIKSSILTENTSANAQQGKTLLGQ